MKKKYLIKNQENFQGEKYLKNQKNYFEGWYYKLSNFKYDIAIIPGISETKNHANCFIQIITNNKSYFVYYNIDDFEYGFNPFYIKIGNNYFTKDYLHLDVTKKQLSIKGYVELDNHIEIKKTKISPNIMGPFSYIPFMECNHAVISMKSNANGNIKLNDKKINYKDGTSYIEKDWGSSFPDSYVWCQANNFKNENASFMLSVASIPFLTAHFTGLICVLMVDNIEYKFTTYNLAKIIKQECTKERVDIILKKKDYVLSIKAYKSSSQKLAAPQKGKMTKEILETITAKIKVTLKKNNKIIFSDISEHCGLELVE